MNNLKVSVIVPVYNNERFLKRCLESIVKQTLKNIEIVIVNDGSTDNSLEVLQDYAFKHDNILLLDQENQGQAIAINRALDKARGEYIAFVDADDYIEKDMMETLYKEAKSNDLDLVICNWDRVDENGALLGFNDHPDFDNVIFNRNIIIHEFFLNQQELVEGFSWNKLFKRKLFCEFKIRFPNIKYADIPTTFRILNKINKGKYINKKLYHYVQHQASITHSKNMSNTKNFIEAIQMIDEIMLEENMLLDFKEDYFIYACSKYINEYCSSYELIRSSEEMSMIFKRLLKPITIKNCITFCRLKKFKLFLKAVLYKMGMLNVFTSVYHKFRPIY